jgi:hypothetical protein
MTATFTPEPETREPSAEPAREIPVLFHLMDVSRQRGKRAKVDEPRVASEFHELVVQPPAEPQAEIPPAQPLCEPADAFPSAAAGSDCSLCKTEEAPAPSAEATAEPTISAESDTPAETAAEEEASPEATVSPRERAEQRRRQRHTVGQPGWFASQGKYLAIGFAVALIGTVIVARMGKRNAASPVATPHAHPGAAATADKQPAAAELVIEMPAKGGQSADSPAKAATAANGKSSEEKPASTEVQLHSPQLSVPQLAETKPADTKPSEKPTDAGLFPWGGRSDVRVAAQPIENPTLRTDTTSAQAVPSGALPGAPGPALASPTAMPPASPPAMGPAGAPQPSYDSAPPQQPAYGSAPPQQPAYGSAPPQSAYGAPPTAYGAAPTAYGAAPTAYGAVPAAAGADQPLYPTTDYRSQFQPVAADPAGVGPVGPNGAPAYAPAPAGGPYYPTTNSASGYRHERTGSGLY